MSNANCVNSSCHIIPLAREEIILSFVTQEVHFCSAANLNVVPFVAPLVLLEKLRVIVHGWKGLLAYFLFMVEWTKKI